MKERSEQKKSLFHCHSFLRPPITSDLRLACSLRRLIISTSPARGLNIPGGFFGRARPRNLVLMMAVDAAFCIDEENGLGIRRGVMARMKAVQVR